MHPTLLKNITTLDRYTKKSFEKEIMIMPDRTRTEFPSSEAIDVRKVNIGSIVTPGTKFKAGKNLNGQTEFKAGSAYRLQSWY